MAMQSSSGSPDITAWRAQVDKELAGAPFEKLVHVTAEGLAIAPLYTERVAGDVPPAMPYAATSGESRAFGVCVRVASGAILDEEIAGGADAVWVDASDREIARAAIARGIHTVIELSGAVPHDLLDAAPAHSRVWLGIDPIAAAARGELAPDALAAEIARLPALLDNLAGVRAVRISSTAFHDAGADAADELAFLLSTAVAYLRALTDGGIALERAAGQLWFQLAVGRDTFGELCKLRALRVVAHKLFTAAGTPHTSLDAVHVVCSTRTATQRDPWVNMLRATTQVFAAVLGGAHLVTPLPFDAALAEPSALGNRVARNTALVLREESQLGRVLDPGAGAYYLEARTDALAREAWSRFQAIERDGGIATLLASGALRERLDAAWRARAGAIGKRKEPVLGVSEFANLDEKLPSAIAPSNAPIGAPALAPHRDAEAFEALRARFEAAPPAVVLLTLGPPAEHRARVGYAAALFAAAGLRAREVAEPVAADIACICGSDERYAAEAAAAARALGTAGAKRIVLAGRPGPLEAELRAAGIDTFIYMGCDALATLTRLAEVAA